MSTQPTQAQIDTAAAEAQKKALEDAKAKKTKDAETAKKDAATAKKDAATAAEKAARATDDRKSAERNEAAAKDADKTRSTPQTQAALAEATQATENARTAETNAKNDAVSAAAASSAADKKAADAVNAANPPATNTLPGLKFMTVGTSEKITVGTDSSLSIGASTKLALSNTVSLTAGMSNTVAFGTTQAINFGPKLTWNLSPKCDSYSLDEGTSYSFSEKKDEKAAVSYTISAGSTANVAAREEALNTVKRRLKTSLVAMSAVNVAVGVAAGVAMGAVSSGEGTQNYLDASKTSSGLGLASVLTASGVTVATAVTSMASLAAIYVALKAWKKQYDLSITRPSTIVLDKDGIKQSAIFTETGSMLNLLASGVQIKSGRLALAVDDEPRVLVRPEGVSSVTLSHDGHAAMNGQESTTINSPNAVKVGQFGDAGLKTGLSAMPETVELKNTVETTVTLKQKCAKIKSPKASLVTDETHGFSVDGDVTKMHFDTTKVAADKTSLTLTCSGTTMKLEGKGVTITSNRIQLG